MSIRILLADDHAVFRSSVRALLEKESDLEVVAEAQDGLEAIQAVSAAEIDVLLLDLSMPALSGNLVARRLLHGESCPKIVVLTMHEKDLHIKELLSLGVHGYVSKKSTGTDLIQAIRAVYRGERYVDPSLAGHVISSLVCDRTTDETDGGFKLLTRREKEVCRLLARGHTNVEIAAQLSISQRTVETHRSSIMAKLGLKSRAHLVRFAIDQGLLKL